MPNETAQVTQERKPVRRMTLPSMPTQTETR